MTKSGVLLDGKTLKLDDVLDVATGRAVVQVDAAVRERLARARALVDDMTRGDEPHYGINTGFGALAEKKIPRDKLAVLQKNLIESHAVGTGEPMSVEVARGLMMLRAATLAVGHSGCRPLVLDALVAAERRLRAVRAEEGQRRRQRRPCPPRSRRAVAARSG